MEKRCGIALIAVALVGLPVSAEGPAAENLIVSVKGVQKGQRIQLQVQGGFAATRGVRIYSAPSDTLLAVVIDSAFQKTKEGQDWLNAALFENGKKSHPPVASGTLPGLRSSLSTSNRPAGDDEVRVWVNGSWPDGTEEDRLVAQNRSAGDNFGFSINLGDDPSMAGGVQVCCACGACATCSSTVFTCCCPCVIVCASVDCPEC